MKKYLMFAAVTSLLMAGSSFGNDGPGSNGHPSFEQQRCEIVQDNLMNEANGIFDKCTTENLSPSVPQFIGCVGLFCPGSPNYSRTSGSCVKNGVRLLENNYKAAFGSDTLPPDLAGLADQVGSDPITGEVDEDAPTKKHLKNAKKTFKKLCQENSPKILPLPVSDRVVFVDNYWIYDNSKFIFFGIASDGAEATDVAMTACGKAGLVNCAQTKISALPSNLGFYSEVIGVPPQNRDVNVYSDPIDFGSLDAGTGPVVYTPTTNKGQNAQIFIGIGDAPNPYVSAFLACEQAGMKRCTEVNDIFTLPSVNDPIIQSMGLVRGYVN
jgi:hypothetical protein